MWTNLFIGKIRCLMHLIHKVHVKFEVNEMGNHFYSQSVISLQCLSLVSLTLLWRVMAK